MVQMCAMAEKKLPFQVTAVRRFHLISDTCQNPIADNNRIPENWILIMKSHIDKVPDYDIAWKRLQWCQAFCTFSFAGNFQNIPFLTNNNQNPENNNAVPMMMKHWKIFWAFQHSKLCLFTHQSTIFFSHFSPFETLVFHGSRNAILKANRR